VQTRLVSLTDISSDDVASWCDLARRAAEPNPLFEPAALVSAVDYFPALGQVTLVSVHDGPTWRGLLPVRPALRRPPHRSFLTTQLWTEDPFPGPSIGVPLVDTGDVDGTIRALLGALAEMAGKYPGVLILDRFDRDGLIAEGFAAQAAALRMPAYVRPAWPRAVVRREGGSRWEQALVPGALKKARRRGRRLSEQLGSEVHLVDRSADLSAIDDFIALESAGWKGRSGTALACLPLHEAYFRDMCGRFAADDRFGIIALEVAGVSIAMRCYVRAGDGMFLLRRAYDEQYATFGPGGQLDVMFTEYLLDHTNTAWADFAHGPHYSAHYLGVFRCHVDVASMVIGTGNSLDRLEVRRESRRARKQSDRTR
jgi:Acetyltransferase (GNAT) domain